MKTILLIPVFLFASLAHGQDSVNWHLKNRTIYAEALGIGWLYSLNYEWLIKLSNSTYLVPSIGVEYDRKDMEGSLLVPVRVHYLAGKRNLFFDAGLDFIWEHAWVTAFTPFGAYTTILNHGGIEIEIGGRYYFKRFFIKASLLPNSIEIGHWYPLGLDYRFPTSNPKNHIGKKIWPVWPTIGIGYSFNARFAH